MNKKLKEEKSYGLNVDLLTENEENIGFNADAFLDDKLSRAFLCNHIGEHLILQGKFISYGHKGSALFDCYLKEEWAPITFYLGHMWWQNVYQVNANLIKGKYITAYGQVYEYNDKYGFEVIKILE